LDDCACSVIRIVKGCGDEGLVDEDVHPLTRGEVVPVHAHGLAGGLVDRAVAGVEGVDGGGLRGLRDEQDRSRGRQDRAEKLHRGFGTPHEEERIG
jgi:hypothetical protein